MDSVAKMISSDRRDLFNEAAKRLGHIAPVLIEKDFWVCWLLKHLFSLSLQQGMIFKGGTSLSKVFYAIERFSEDVDISLDRITFGFKEQQDPALAPSGKKARSLLQDLQHAAEDWILNRLKPSLTERIGSLIGPSQNKTWRLQIDSSDAQTLLFYYPIGVYNPQDTLYPYIEPSVRIELGCRGEVWPAEDHSIQCYAAGAIPELFKNPNCPVHVLASERTFWEKATLLHAEHHRPKPSASGARLSRHYYDLARLSESEIGERALHRLDLLESVVKHKRVFFRSGWAHYDSAKVGSFRLVPPPERIAALANDYKAMQDMFFNEPPIFSKILETLTRLEQRINTVG